EACLLRPENFVLRKKGSTHRADQIEHIVAHEREILDLLLSQYLTHGRGGCRDEVLSLYRHLNRLRGRGHLEREVQPKLSCIAKLNVVECLGLESWKSRTDLISSR